MAFPLSQFQTSRDRNEAGNKIPLRWFKDRDVNEEIITQRCRQVKGASRDADQQNQDTGTTRKLQGQREEVVLE